MAIKDDKDGKDEADAAPPPQKRVLSKKMLLIAAGALVLVLAGGGAGAYVFFLRPGAHAADSIPPVPPKIAYSDMDDLLVNIQGPDATPVYLKLSVALELDDPAAKAGVAALMPRVRDQFQAYLRELRLSDLKGSEGVMRLKEELLRRAEVAVAPYRVRDVLLKQMIVQ